MTDRGGRERARSAEDAADGDVPAGRPADELPLPPEAALPIPRGIGDAAAAISQPRLGTVGAARTLKAARDASPGQAAPADLARRSARGGVLMIGSQIGGILATLTATMVLARLLTPAEFGAVAMVGTLTALLMLCADLGLSQAMIQSRHVTDAQVSMLFWANAAFGLGLATLCFAAAPLLAAFYDYPELAPLARVMALDFLILGLAAQFQALLSRRLQFGALARINIASFVVGATAAIALALLGAGIWSLVALQLVMDLTTLIGSVAAARWCPGLPRRTEGLGRLLRFGRNVALANLAGYPSANVDRVLIGAAYGEAAIGLYDRSSNMVRLPVRALVQPLQRVVVPALARAQDDPPAYARLYAAALRRLAMLTFPVSLGLAALAPEVVAIVLGEAWAAATPILSLLAIAACAHPLSRAAGWLWVSQGRTVEQLRFGVLSAVVTVAGYALALRGGPTAVAASAIASHGGLLVLAFVLTTRTGPVRLGEIGWAVLPGLAGGVAVVLAVEATRLLCPMPEAPLLRMVVLGPPALAALLALYLAVPSARSALVDLSRMRRAVPA